MGESSDIPHTPRANSPVQGNTTPSARSDVSFPAKRRKKFNKVFLLIPLLLLIGALVYFIFTPPSGESTEAGPTPSLTLGATSTPSPTPTPAPEIDRSEVSIQVLNGTGIPGEAAFLQDKLEALGYSDIDVGNASDQDYETTEVIFSGNVSDNVLKDITENIENLYNDVKQSESESLKYDVRIITGLRPGKEFPATPTPKPTSNPATTPSASPTGTVTPTVTGTLTPSPTGTLTPTPSQ